MFDPKTNKFPYPMDTGTHYLGVKKDNGNVYDTNYPYIDKSKSFKKTDYFLDLLGDITYRSHMTDVLDYAINKAEIKPNEIQGEDNLIYYRKYSRKDVFKIMNFDKDQNPQNVGSRNR